MNIIDVKILKGPNRWSVEEKQLIELKLGDVLVYETTENWNKAFFTAYPELGTEEFTDPQDAVTLVASLALKLQLLAGIHVAPVCHGHNYSGLAVYPYEQERAGVYAGEAAVMLVNAFSEHHTIQTSAVLEKLSKLKNQAMPGATSAYILGEAKKRQIPFSRFNGTSLFILGYGNMQKRLRTAVSGATSGIGIELAGDKEETRQMLLRASIPVPRGIIVYSEQELLRSLPGFMLPVVVKPLDGNQGRGVTTHIMTEEKAIFGFQVAQKLSDAVIVEEHIQGEDYRLLVVDYKLVAVARRSPAQIRGNGRSSVRELIEIENNNPERGDSQEHVLAKIKLDPSTFKLLSEKGYDPDTVLKSGETLILKETANISAGGTAEDVTDLVHPEIRFMAERIARLFELDICGIDVMTTSIEQPLIRERGAVIEVNAGPGLRMHSNPQKGKARNVAAAIMDMLFPDPRKCRIPVVAVTGINDKTTTTRLIAYLAEQAGYEPGFCTSEGIYIRGHCILRGDCTGHRSAQDVLFDPTINLAVLECSPGGIIRSGLAFDQCDISVVTNISGDQGFAGTQTLDDTVEIVRTVPLSTKKGGYAILNADDDLVYTMTGKLNCHVALFSMNFASERIRKHCSNGGIAAFLQDDRLMLHFHEKLHVIVTTEDLPLSFNIESAATIRNILAACLAGAVLGINPESMHTALKNFRPSEAA